MVDDSKLDRMSARRHDHRDACDRVLGLDETLARDGHDQVDAEPD